MLPHGLRPALGELHVVIVLAARVGVPLDPHRHGGARLQNGGDLVEQREAAGLDGRLVGVEEDLLFELDLLLGDHDVLVLLRAAVVVGRARIVGALVSGVEHAVLVVVRIGAAIGVLEPVLVLRLHRTLVDVVQDAVGVVVRIGAAVGVLEPVLVLRLHRTLVGLVGDAVLVVVGIGAAVGVLEPVLVLGLRRALVGLVRDAVAVGVERHGRRHALVPRRQVIGLARVVIGDVQVVARPEVIPLGQLPFGELDVRIGQGQFPWRALVGAVVARLLGDGAHLADAVLHLRTGAARQGDRTQRRRDDGGLDRRSHSGTFSPRSRARCLAAAAAGSSVTVPGSSFCVFGT